MSRKDFILIAGTINRLNLPPEGRALVGRAFAEELRSTNPRFDADRFMAAVTK